MHVRGALNDTSRIISISYKLPEGVYLTESAFQDWTNLELDAAQKFLTITGGIIILPERDGAPALDRWTSPIPITSGWTKHLDANNEECDLLNNKHCLEAYVRF